MHRHLVNHSILLDAGAQPVDFIAALPTASLYPQRLLWRRQIEWSYDRTQSLPVIRQIMETRAGFVALVFAGKTA